MKDYLSLIPVIGTIWVRKTEMRMVDTFVWMFWHAISFCTILAYVRKLIYN